MDTDGFVVVGRGKRAQRQAMTQQQQQQQEQNASTSQTNDNDLPTFSEAAASRHRSATPEEVEERVRGWGVKLAKYFGECASKFQALPIPDAASGRDSLASSAAAVDSAANRNRPRVLALGLGSFEESPRACAQLALLMWLTAENGPWGSAAITLFDPAMSAVDRKVCASLGICGATDGETSGHQVGNHAAEFSFPLSPYEAYYMPHCPKSLLETVLLEIVSGRGTPRSVIVGNSAESYRLRGITREQRDALVVRLSPRITEDALPPCKAIEGAFNDLAVMRLAADIPADERSELVAKYTEELRAQKKTCC